MKLTGKALEDFKIQIVDLINKDRLFNKVNKNAVDWVLNAPDIILNAHIIEWFDSVGIYITVNYNFINAKWTNSLKDKDTILHRGELYNTRQEATEKAIEKANLIYNDTI